MSKEIDTKQMSLLEDSHVNHSQLPVKEKEQMTTDTSGMKLLESLENVNQSGSLAKMLKVLLTSKKAWYSDRCKLIWKKKVSKSNVLLFQLQGSVLGIKEKESGLSDAMYPTPTSQDHSRNTVPPSIGKTRGMDLSMRVVADQIKMYQTPTATEIEMRSPEAMEKRRKYRESIGRKTVPPGNLLEQIQMMYPTPTQDSASERTKKYKQGGTPLPVAVRMYPTPRSSGQENPETLIKRKGLRAAAQHNLTAAVKMFPTPTRGCEEGGEQSERVEQTKSGGFILRKKNNPNKTFGAKLSDAMIYLEKKMYKTPMARDHKDINFNNTWKLGNKAQSTMAREVLKDNKPGGKLNPNFVEFLMGYPMNWTKIEPTE